MRMRYPSYYPSITLHWHPEPFSRSGHHILLDGERIADPLTTESAVPFRTEPGEHTIEIRGVGAKSNVFKFHASEGETVDFAAGQRPVQLLTFRRQLELYIGRVGYLDDIVEGPTELTGAAPYVASVFLLSFPAAMLGRWVFHHFPITNLKSLLSELLETLPLMVGVAVSSYAGYLRQRRIESTLMLVLSDDRAKRRPDATIWPPPPAIDHAEN